MQVLEAPVKKTIELYHIVSNTKYKSPAFKKAVVNFNTALNTLTAEQKNTFLDRRWQNINFSN